jgi:hypothetical protein
MNDMLPRSMRIGLIVIIVALLLGNLATCVGLTNDLQTKNSQIGTPQTKDYQECHGSNPDKCNGQCVNLHEDKQNCGRCGKACDPDETCHDGRCVSSNETIKQHALMVRRMARRQILTVADRPVQLVPMKRL